MNCYNISLLILTIIISAFAEKIYYEAENGELNGVTVFDELNGFSGSGYVGKFENPGNSVTVSVNITEPGMYDLSISYNGNMGQKVNILTVNGESAGEITFPETKDFEILDVGTVFLSAGKNTIGITSSWGWMYVDAFIINDTPNEVRDVKENISPNLVNPNATPSAKKLYEFLRSNYGKRILSGQVGKPGYAGDEGEEFERIKNVTGKMPALWNMDFIFESNDCTWRPTNPDIIEMALDWWEKYKGKGIMNAQWHWNIAGKTGDYGFYKKDTTFDIEQAVIEGTWEYEKAIKDIDRISEYFKKLQAVNMPVIWRPLHENNGDWFWWGNNPAACAKLWKIMYDRMVNYHGLNNLIWLWNGSNDEYTPIEYIDMVGADIYVDDHATQSNSFNTHFDFYEGKKMVVLSEVGRVPVINQCVEQNVWWGYFQVWNGEFILDNSYHTDEELKEIYNNEIVMNMDELPSFNVPNDEETTVSNEDNKPTNDNEKIIENETTINNENNEQNETTIENETIENENNEQNETTIENETPVNNDENNKSNECFSVELGYPCCVTTTNVRFIDENGRWGVENGEWCGLN